MWRLALLVALAALLVLPAQASGEPAKAGPFYRQGMAAMWDIGLMLPFDRDARIAIRDCGVGRRRAVCLLAVRVASRRPCRVTAVLSRDDYRLPLRLWHCPIEWKPVPGQALRRRDLRRLMLTKALRRR